MKRTQWRATIVGAGLVVMTLLLLTAGAFAGTTNFDTLVLGGTSGSYDLTLSGGATIDNTSTTLLTITETNISLVGAVSFTGSTSFYGSSTKIGYDSGACISFAVADTTGVTTVTHVGSGPTMAWTVPAWTNTNSTSYTTYTPSWILGYDSGAAMTIAVSDTTGSVAITHAGSTKAVTWTASGGFDFVGAFTADALTLSDVLTFSDGATIDNTSATTLTLTEDTIALVGIADITGNLAQDGTTVVLDGSTSVRLLSAGFTSIETSASDFRIGYDASVYTKFAVANTTGNMTITHVGGTTDLVTWTAAGGFSFVGNTAITGTLGCSGTLSVGLDATAGMLELYPATTNKGTTTVTMADNTGDTITNLNFAAQAGARTLTVPDAGASASFVLMTAGQAVAGTLTRADLTEEALAIYGLPSTAVMQATGIPLAASETAGTFNISLASDVWLVQGEISISETETSEGALQFVLPPEYVAGGDIKVRLKNRLVLGAGTNNGSTLDVEAFEQDGNGAIGADLCTTTAVTYAAASAWQTSDFVVTGTGLVAGDILNIVITANVVESGGSAIHAELDGIALLLDIKG